MRARISAPALGIALALGCGPATPAAPPPAPGADEAGFTAPSQATADANARFGAALPLADEQDFADAKQGLIESEPGLRIELPGGRAFDQASFAFVSGDAPASVNPSLWRQAKLNGIHGLFRVAEGIYQVRGYDVSNMTWIRGKSGWIVVDPLTSVEAAAAAVALARKHLGNDPVTTLIFTHSHVDHFAGARAVVPDDALPGVRVVAPKRFVEEVTSENVLAGVAMGRRATYQFGLGLPDGPRGYVDTGLGKQPASGTSSFAMPTDLVDHTPQELELDGVPFVFQYAPESEAPAELTFYLPDVEGLLRRGDREPHHAQPLHAARREGARRAQVERLHRRGDPALPGRRGRVREPHLAHVREGARARVPQGPARHLPVHPRPDAAARKPRARTARDRRGDRAPAAARESLREPRLLRHGPPQREGRLPVLLRVVRRKPREPRSAAARPAGQKVRGGDGRRGRREGPRARRARGRRLSLGGDAPRPSRLRRARGRRGARAPGLGLRPARLSGGERGVARGLSARRGRAAPRHLRPHGRRLQRGRHPGAHSARPLLRRDGDARRRREGGGAGPADRELRVHATWARRTSSRSRTPSSTTGSARPIRRPRPPCASPARCSCGSAAARRGSRTSSSRTSSTWTGAGRPSSRSSRCSCARTGTSRS